MTDAGRNRVEWDPVLFSVNPDDSKRHYSDVSDSYFTLRRDWESLHFPVVAHFQDTENQKTNPSRKRDTRDEI